jgi:hypothetical protein
MASLADTLETPYYAAIIETKPAAKADEPVSDADRLVTLAVRRPGFLGLETARARDGRSVTVAYWRELADVEGWTTEGANGAKTKFPLEVCRVANPADPSVRGLYEVPEDSRTTWRYT